jgi:RimJ/RimL family protein N-acetyltransferase
MAMRRIEADVDPRNLPSLRTLEALGFRREGYLRQRWQVGGELQDSVLMGLLASDWPSAG